MPFDPNQPFEIVEEPSQSGFDPNQPFEIAVDPNQASIDAFIKSQQASPLSKIETGISDLAKALVVEPVKATPRVLSGFADIANDPNATSPIGVRIGQNIVEAGGRAVFDLGSAINNLVSNFGTNLKKDGLSTAVSRALPAFMTRQGLQERLTPRTPNQGEIDQFLEEQLKASQVRAVKSQPLVPELIPGATNISLAEDIQSASVLAPLVGPAVRGTGVLAEAVLSPVQTAKALSKSVAPTLTRSLTRELEDFATDVIKPPKKAQKQLIKDLSSGEFQDNLRAISSQGKPTGLVNTLEKSIPELENISTKIEDFKKANADIKFSNNDISDEINTLAKSDRFEEESVKTKLNSLADKFKGEFTLEQGFDDLNTLNKRRRAYYEKSQAGKTNDLDDLVNEAEQLARDRLSQKMDDIYRAKSGNTDNPYRRYGSLRGFIDDLSARGDELITAQRIQRSKGPTFEREILATLQKNAELLRGGELTRIDKTVSRMFDALENTPQPSTSRVLTPQERAAGADQLNQLLRENILRQSGTDLNLPRGQSVPLGQGLPNIGPESTLEQLLRNAQLRDLENQALSQSTRSSEELRRRLLEMMQSE